MKVVVLTNQGSRFGIKLLNALVRADVSLHAIVVLHPSLNYHRRLFRWVVRRVGWRDALSFAARRLRESRRPLPPNWQGAPLLGAYTDFGSPVHHVGDANDAHTINVLRSLEPDLVSLGQTGIIGADILEVPRRGVLNAHPGWLPDYRGIDCGRWAVLRGDFAKLGATVHWVDAGVDTGPIIRRRRLDLCVEIDSLEALDEALDDLAVTLMAEVVAELQAGAELRGEPQAADSGQQYYKMPRHMEREAASALRQRLATLDTDS